MEARIASKKRCMTRLTDSGSSPSPSAVEPTTSQKTIVTVLRASDDASARTRAAPHSPQNLLVSGLAWPHARHEITCAAYGSGRSRRERTSVSSCFRQHDGGIEDQGDRLSGKQRPFGSLD